MIVPVFGKTGCLPKRSDSISPAAGNNLFAAQNSAAPSSSADRGGRE
jgi:hypothetical protein